MSRTLTAAVAAVIVLAGAASASADTVEDPIHFICLSPTTCTAAGGAFLNQNTSDPTPSFGLIATAATTAGTLHLDVLIGSQLGTAPSFTGIGTSPNLTTTLFSTTAWSSGDLAAYLFGTPVSNQPANPIAAFQGGGPFFVYDVHESIGTGLPGTSPGSVAQPFEWTAATLPVGAIVVAFLDEGATTCNVRGHAVPCENVIGTSPTESLLITRTTGGGGGGDTPLPAAVWLMGSVLGGGAGFGAWRRRKSAKSA